MSTRLPQSAPARLNRGVHVATINEDRAPAAVVGDMVPVEKLAGRFPRRELVVAHEFVGREQLAAPDPENRAEARGGDVVDHADTAFEDSSSETGNRSSAFSPARPCS